MAPAALPLAIMKMAVIKVKRIYEPAENLAAPRARVTAGTVTPHVERKTLPTTMRWR